MLRFIQPKINELFLSLEYLFIAWYLLKTDIIFLCILGEFSQHFQYFFQEEDLHNATRARQPRRAPLEWKGADHHSASQGTFNKNKLQYLSFCLLFQNPLFAHNGFQKTKTTKTKQQQTFGKPCVLTSSFHCLRTNEHQELLPQI